MVNNNEAITEVSRNYWPDSWKFDVLKTSIFALEALLPWKIFV